MTAYSLSKNCELVVFDLDGTLIDSRLDIASSINHTLTHMELAPLSVEKITSFIGKGVKSLLTEALGSRAEEYFDRAIKVFRHHYRDHCLDKTVLYPHAKEILETMPVNTKAIVTNKPKLFTEIVLKGLGIDRFFSRVLSGDQVPKRKPSPDPILMLCYEFKRAPSKVLMVGDSPLDIRMGSSAGAKTCAAFYGYGKKADLESENPDFKINSMAELGALFVI